MDMRLKVYVSLKKVCVKIIDLVVRSRTARAYVTSAYVEQGLNMRQIET